MSFVPPRKARWGLTVYGLVFVAQGLGKALDADGYLAALASFHVMKPVSWWPLSLGALGLAWTVLELLAGVAMLYGGLARAPAKELVLSGVVVAVGMSCAYLALDVGALLRHLPIQNCTCFGTYLAQRLSWFVLVQESAVIALLAWLFASTTRWPRRGRVAAPEPPHHSRRRSPFAAWFTAP